MRSHIIYFNQGCNHFFRTDPIPDILRIGRYRSNPIPVFFCGFFINVEFLYFSVWTRSSLLCVVNTIYTVFLNKSAGYAAQ